MVKYNSASDSLQLQLWEHCHPHAIGRDPPTTFPAAMAVILTDFQPSFQKSHFFVWADTFLIRLIRCCFRSHNMHCIIVCFHKKLFFFGEWQHIQEEKTRKTHCTMPFPMSIEILEILKSKNSFLAHFFWSKNGYSSSRLCRRVQILEWIFGFIYFAKYLRSYLQKTRRGGVWQIWNLACKAVRSCREKKFKIAFCQTSPSWSTYLNI